jgi:tetratricopeptide (TPR) repeat protein
MYGVVLDGTLYTGPKESIAMNEAKTYTLEEAHQHFAKTLNGKVWELLQKSDRSKSEDELMIYAAHASCYHWLNAGTGLHHQRAEWLIAHVYTELGMADSALRHASRCLELTNEFANLMKDFDWAYAYEGVARANALAGNQDKARKYIQRAEETGQAILNDEDKSIFLGDFSDGKWYGLR